MLQDQTIRHLEQTQVETSWVVGIQRVEIIQAVMWMAITIQQLVTALVVMLKVMAMLPPVVMLGEM